MIPDSDLDRYDDLRSSFKIKADETNFLSLSNSDLQIKIENFCTSLLPEMNRYVPPPKTPIQEFILNGTLEIPFGTISIADVPGQNVYWNVPVAEGVLDGTLSEMFVSGKNVYGIGEGGIPLFTPVLFTDAWVPLPIQVYKDLRATATKIVVGKIVPATPQ